MKKNPAPTDQLPLTLPMFDPVTLPCSAEPPLLQALADLLVAFARHEARAKGAGDERKDS